MSSKTKAYIEHRGLRHFVDHFKISTQRFLTGPLFTMGSTISLPVSDRVTTVTSGTFLLAAAHLEASHFSEQTFLVAERSDEIVRWEIIVTGPAFDVGLHFQVLNTIRIKKSKPFFTHRRDLC